MTDKIPRQCPVCWTWFDVKVFGPIDSVQKACPNCGVVQLIKFSGPLPSGAASPATLE